MFYQNDAHSGSSVPVLLARQREHRYASSPRCRTGANPLVISLLGNAAIEGLVEDLNLVGNRFNVALVMISAYNFLNLR